MIDWSSEKNEVLFNPRMPEVLKKEMFAALPCLSHLKGHVCLATSGSNGLKWAVLSKQGILISAQAVNDHLVSDRSDCWLNPLPLFHVGGMGIIARGHLSDASVIACHFPDSKWSPEHFFKQLTQSHATLTSLVPTQVFDLISCGFKAPNTLRAVIVGGGALSEKVYFSAIDLGWKLLPSYGLTECSSQVATAKYGSWNDSEYPLLKPLSHIRIATNEEGYLKIRSEALLSGYIEKGSEGFCLHDPKIDGWLTTEDKILFEGESIRSVSRGENFVKIGGESVDLLRLESILEEEKFKLNLKEDVALIALEDERLGYRLHLVVASPLNENIKKLIECYRKKVFPFERMSYVHCVKEIPRSPLKKLLKNELKKLLE